MSLPRFEPVALYGDFVSFSGSIGLFWLEKLIIDRSYVYDAFTDDERNNMYFQKKFKMCLLSVHF